MGRQKIRDMHRKQRRQRKLRNLKQRLAETKVPKEREALIEKIRKISMYPDKDAPRE